MGERRSSGFEGEYSSPSGWLFGADSYGQTRRNLVLQSSITKIPYRGLFFNATSSANDQGFLLPSIDDRIEGMRRRRGEGEDEERIRGSGSRKRKTTDWIDFGSFRRMIGWRGLSTLGRE